MLQKSLHLLFDVDGGMELTLNNYEWSWAPGSYDSGTPVCDYDGSLKLIWDMLRGLWAYVDDASQFMVAAGLYVETWVSSCAFLMWAPGTITCISIYICVEFLVHDTRFGMTLNSLHGMSWVVDWVGILFLTLPLFFYLFVESCDSILLYIILSTGKTRAEGDSSSV